MHMNCADFVYKAMGELFQVLYHGKCTPLSFTGTIVPDIIPGSNFHGKTQIWQLAVYNFLILVGQQNIIHFSHKN